VIKCPSSGSNIQTFSAIDRWLDRSVVMLFDTVAGGCSLTATCKAVAGVRSSHVIDVYDYGGNAGYRYAVFERPVSTIASLAQESNRDLWNEGRAIDTAKELVIGLSDLHRAGVETSGLHLGSIGVDDIGRVRVSPWPLVDPVCVGGDSSTPTNDLEMVASVLETGIRASGSAVSSPAASLAARLRRPPGESAPIATDQLLEALAVLEPPERDKPTGVVPVTPVGEVSFNPNLQFRVFRRRRRRRRHRRPMAAGAALTVLVVVVLMNTGSHVTLSSASGASKATATCPSKPKACPTSTASKTPRPTVAAPNSFVAPASTGASTAKINVASPVDTTPVTAIPATTATTATTTTTTSSVSQGGTAQP
jgi:hypothetical protein